MRAHAEVGAVVVGAESSAVHFVAWQGAQAFCPLLGSGVTDVGSGAARMCSDEMVRAPRPACYPIL